MSFHSPKFSRLVYLLSVLLSNSLFVLKTVAITIKCNLILNDVYRINSMLFFVDLATFDGAESRVSTLVAAANSPDNLCRMDPAWHPWM